jgi:hypothetical protein
MTAGLLALFAGYTIASYGVVLLRGYDIKWREWISPIRPYQWPKGKVPHVPPERVFP